VILVALGANLSGPAGAPAAQLAAALDAIDAEIGRVVACSRFYDSPAWPDPREPRYVNAVAAIEATRAPAANGPAELLAALLALEVRLGRRRDAPGAPLTVPLNAPRAIDLDIIDYDGLVRASPPPILPHPRLAARGFVLRPLAEIAPGWRHPVTHESIAALIAALPPDAEAVPLAQGWARGARADRV
jgi:2-amino-4-hydroxy-6-hydroxymethyldihydropteridine diphosphokinase